MDGVRDDLIRQIKLTKFDPTKQLVIYSDASQVGIGSFLAQQNDDGSLETIAYFSKRLSPAMQRNGATVREAYGVIMALQAAKPYVMCSQRPTIVYSDARSLSFVQQSTRSELSIRLLQQVEGLSFELRYVAGRLNSAADGLSRLGMEGARTLSAVGYTSALDDLLERLSDSPVRKADSVWVYMSEHWSVPPGPIVAHAARQGDGYGQAGPYAGCYSFTPGPVHTPVQYTYVCGASEGRLVAGVAGSNSDAPRPGRRHPSRRHGSNYPSNAERVDTGSQALLLGLQPSMAHSQRRQRL